MLELSDRGLKIPVCEMSKGFVEKVDNMCRQIGKFIREVRTTRKSSGNCRNKLTQINSFDRPSSGLDTAEERITEPEDGQQGLSKPKGKEGQFKKADYSRVKGQNPTASQVLASLQSGSRKR